jgi:hypothetical protein
MPENTLMKRAIIYTYSVLAHEYGSHTHAGTDTHARHKDALSCLLCNIQASGDLARTGYCKTREQMVKKTLGRAQTGLKNSLMPRG